VQTNIQTQPDGDKLIICLRVKRPGCLEVAPVWNTWVDYQHGFCFSLKRIKLQKNENFTFYKQPDITFNSLQAIFNWMNHSKSKTIRQQWKRITTIYSTALSSLPNFKTIPAPSTSCNNSKSFLSQADDCYKWVSRCRGTYVNQKKKFLLLAVCAKYDYYLTEIPMTWYLTDTEEKKMISVFWQRKWIVFTLCFECMKAF